MVKSAPKSLRYEWLHRINPDAEMLRDIGTLLKRLDSPGFDDLRSKVRDMQNAYPASHVLLCIDDEAFSRIVSMATLVKVPATFSQQERWLIEHVATREEYEGFGIATTLCKKLIDEGEATFFGSRYELTSTNPRAVKVYGHIGFEPRATTIMRYNALLK